MPSPQKPKGVVGGAGGYVQQLKTELETLKTQRDSLTASLTKLQEDMVKPVNILKAESAVLEAELGVIRAKESLTQEKILNASPKVFDQDFEVVEEYRDIDPRTFYSHRLRNVLHLSNIVGYRANEWGDYGRGMRNCFFLSLVVTFLAVNVCDHMFLYTYAEDLPDGAFDSLTTLWWEFVIMIATSKWFVGLCGMFMSCYFLFEWGWDKLIFNRVRLVAVPIKDYKILSDERPTFDRATRRASKKVRIYQVCIEYKNIRGFNYMFKEKHFKCFFGNIFYPLVGFLTGIKITKFWDLDKRKFVKLHVSESMLSTALNRKTIMAPTTQLAQERAQRMMMDDNTAQEDYERFLRTGRSVYKDTALVAEWLLAGSASGQTFS